MEELFNLLTLFNTPNLGVESLKKIIDSKADISSETIEINGYKFVVNKEKDGNKYTITVEEVIDNESIIEAIKEYKNNIDELDDCLFLTAAEELEKYVDIKKFNDLLEKESFSNDEAEKVLNTIELSSKIISTLLADKVEELNKLRLKFSR